MATSVYEIDVDDERFKEFLGLFQKHQAELKELGSKWADVVGPADAVSEAVAEMTGDVKEAANAWGDTSRIVETISGGIRDMTASMMAQTAMLHKQREEKEEGRRDEAKAEKARRDSERSQARALEQRKKVSGQLVKDAGSIAKGIGSATLSLVKWVSLGGLAGVITSGFGMGTLANRVGGALREAQGVGVGTAEHQALNLNYGRFTDVNSNLASLSAAQVDPSKQWAFAASGIDPAGKDPAALYLDSVKQAKRIFDEAFARDPRTAGAVAQSRGLMEGGLGFSLQDLRRLNAASPDDMGNAARRMEQDRKQLALSEEVQRRWQDFSYQIQRVILRLQNGLAPAFEKMIGPVTKLSDKIVDAINAFTLSPGFQKGLDDFGNWIEDFAKWIGTDDFKDKMVKLGDGVALVGKVILAVAEKLKWLIPKDDEQVAGVSAKNIISDADRKKNINHAMDYLQTEHGGKWTKNQAAGWVANFDAESNMNPHAVGDGGKAFGIAQWHPDRQKLYEQLYGHTMQSVKDKSMAFREQLGFVAWEQRNNEKRAAESVRLTTSSGGLAAQQVSRYYERPKDTYGEMKKRDARAEVILKVYNTTGGSASVSANQLPK